MYVDAPSTSVGEGVEVAFTFLYSLKSQPLGLLLRGHSLVLVDGVRLAVCVGVIPSVSPFLVRVSCPLAAALISACIKLA
jgi:hypothetical protein